MKNILLFQKSLKRKKYKWYNYQKFYNILNNNKYYNISNFFMFKELIIGHWKNGIVFLGLEIQNERPLQLKSVMKKNTIFFFQ